MTRVTSMGTESVQLLVVRYLTLMALLSTTPLHAVEETIVESPHYTVVLSAPDVEIRQYTDSLWMSAPVPGGTSFNKSTHDGFHRLYQYIHGANADNAKIEITAPVLTTITQTPNGPNYMVNLYLSPKGSPPVPSSQLNLHLSTWKSRCIAVRRFPGFAQDDNINKERESLVSTLAKSLFNGKNIAASEDKSSYSIAQYNASFHLSGRVNEVWINVSPCSLLV